MTRYRSPPTTSPTFTALSKDMTQVGKGATADTVITRDSNDFIMLVGVTKASLVSTDFSFA